MQSQRSTFRVGLLLAIFFVISLLTNLIGPLLPDIIKSFHLSLTMAAFLPFSFFIAYGIMSIPAGVIVEMWGEKPVLLGGFALALGGALLFALDPQYTTALISLVAIGLGMAALQVAVNPLLRVSGGEEHFAFNAVLAQLVFGLASFVSPIVYSRYATGSPAGAWARLVPAEHPWVLMYWIMTAVIVFAMAVIAAVPLARVERKDDERTGAWAVHLKLLKRPVVWLYFLGIFAYVGLEQGLSNWISEFLATVHGYNPQVEGAAAVSSFWLVMTAGCVLGLLLLKFIDSRKVLLGFSCAACAALAAALMGSGETALIAFPVLGFTLSVMWSVVFSLALNSVEDHQGTFSGILCTGITGGAVVPLLIGSAGDHFGLRFGLALLFVPLLYILSIGLWARPLITNKTVSLSTGGENALAEATP